MLNAIVYLRGGWLSAYIYVVTLITNQTRANVDSNKNILVVYNLEL